MSDVDKLAASLLETLRSGERATTHLGWTVPNVNWEPVLDELVRIAHAGAEADVPGVPMVTIREDRYYELKSAEAETERLREALRELKAELGVPDENYPAPVANAYSIANAALAGGQADKEPTK